MSSVRSVGRFGESVLTLPIDRNQSSLVSSFEIIEALLQIFPEVKQDRIAGVLALELCETLRIEFGREYVNLDIQLPGVSRFDRDKVKLFDRIVSKRYAADSHAIAVNENIASQITAAAKDSIRSIGIIDPKR